MIVIPTTSGVILEMLQSLPARVVITKNKHESAQKNFRRDGGSDGRWLDGYWRGVPQNIASGKSFCIHYEERNALLWMGNYSGVISEGDGKYSLIMEDVRCFEIEDFNEEGAAQRSLRSILKQNGPVSYSYYDPSLSNDKNAAAIHSRMALVQQRVQQSLFREKVFAHHGARCVVSGCSVPELIEAAHLAGRDWRLGHNDATDGIPLRVDIHRAYDAGLLTLDGNHRLVGLHEALEADYSIYLKC